MRKQWALKALPDNSDPLPMAWAAAINDARELFWTRWGANRAKRFYSVPGLPVMLIVVNIDD